MSPQYPRFATTPFDVLIISPDARVLFGTEYSASPSSNATPVSLALRMVAQQTNQKQMNKNYSDKVK
eukprot:m.139476 g.139476  ORF g.139476 m.139476 type:complete len:67 (-) comp13169_c0_seq28:65-265(-)